MGLWVVEVVGTVTRIIQSANKRLPILQLWAGGLAVGLLHVEHESRQRG
jgi:hypothetical protein